ncbi:hypothetical protein [Terrabacter sp. Root85]
MLPLFESAHPDDTRPQDAMEVARARAGRGGMRHP